MGAGQLHHEGDGGFRKSGINLDEAIASSTAGKLKGLFLPDLDRRLHHHQI